MLIVATAHFEQEVAESRPFQFVTATGNTAQPVVANAQHNITQTTQHRQHTAHTTHTRQHTPHNRHARENSQRRQHTAHTTHNTQHTSHNTQHTAHNTQHTTHSTQHTTHILTGNATCEQYIKLTPLREPVPIAPIICFHIARCAFIASGCTIHLLPLRSERISDSLHCSLHFSIFT